MIDTELVAPPAVRWITRTLEEAGFETWAVGGAIRDAVLGHPSGDWDLATRARPRRVRALFRRTVPIGIEHGTVGVLSRDGVLYEVTTFRRDVETDGRHAVVAFAETLEEDLGRRDFTINAIAWHALREEIRDPFGGIEDLRSGVLRTVGRPEERFREDYLRILRALRFAGRYGLTIEDGTWEALSDLVDHLPELSPERIREELLKVLSDDPHPTRALTLYAESGALGVLYPELAGLRGGVDADWETRLEVVEALPLGRPELRLAALLRTVEAGDAAALLTRLRLSNALTDEIAWLAGAPELPRADAPEADVRAWLSRVGPERLTPVARIQLAEARVGAGTVDAEAVVAAWRRAREVRREAPPLSVGALALDGRDLIGMGLRPGPRFGEILESLLEWVLEDPARNEPDRLRARVLAMQSEGGTEARDG